MLMYGGIDRHIYISILIMTLYHSYITTQKSRPDLVFSLYVFIRPLGMKIRQNKMNY